jgi:glutamate--cysteine ligase
MALLDGADGLALLAQGLRGIEREALRVDRRGHLAASAHPPALGSALTHPTITTDYAEALIELITPPERDTAAMLDGYDALHRFVFGGLGDEMLWSHSMPCRLPAEEDIAIAWYGTSHIGMLKHVYRRGLALRYGKSMQCIAGIHYNYSLPPELWERLRAVEGDGETAMGFQSESYIALIRNFRRYGWLLMYLFGAAPALSNHFQGGGAFPLEQLSADTVYLPYATSLRMSDMGYQNDAQAGLTPDYNTLDSYITSLAAAMNHPYLPYVELGTRRAGEWVQINTNRLQIENEYYSAIRPKRVVHSGERPLHALAQRGVQYVEVRCLDVDPFEPLGIAAGTCHFLDAFLLFCALEDSPLTGADESRENTENFARTVKEGRRPGLLLERHGRKVGLRDWAGELLERIAPMAALLDRARGGAECATALAAQRAKLADVALTPSARVLEAIRAEQGSFDAFALRRSEEHAAHFRGRPLDPAALARFTAEAAASLAEQQRVERADSGEFGQFVQRYQAGARYLPVPDEPLAPQQRVA